MTGRALIACNSPLPAQALVDELAGWADLLVGADSGGDRLAAYGHEPDLVVGDLDSVSQALRDRLGPDRVVRDDDRYTTDLDKTLKHVAGLGATDVRVVGATGDRLDHILGALASLVTAPKGLFVILVDDRFDTWRIDGSTRFQAPKGTVVSLVALGGAQGVTTEGLRWPLNEEDLPFSTLGIHNNVVEDSVEIRVRAGDLFVMKGRFVERHA